MAKKNKLNKNLGLIAIIAAAAIIFLMFFGTSSGATAKFSAAMGGRTGSSVPSLPGGSSGGISMPLAEICKDNIDNDRDGKIDCLDPDCTGKVCAPQLACPPGAAPGNLGGGITKTCVQGVCKITGNTCMEILCADGIDNDLDGSGKNDCADKDCDKIGTCEFGKELTCNDGSDNDGDGMIDCKDTDCFNIAANCIIDLIPAGVSYKGSNGTESEYTAFVKNQGTLQSTQFSISIFDGTNTKSCFIWAVGAGKITSCEVIMPLKVNSLKETVDTNNQVAEYNENNNIATYDV